MNMNFFLQILTLLTCPILAVLMIEGAMLPAFRASLAATARRSDGCTSLSAPPILPKGVRLAATMNIPGEKKYRFFLLFRRGRLWASSDPTINC